MNTFSPTRLLVGLIFVGVLLFAMLVAALKYRAYQQEKPIRDAVMPALEGIDIDKINKDIHDYMEKHRNDPPQQ
jgi:hypothetical protein